MIEYTATERKIYVKPIIEMCEYCVRIIMCHEVINLKMCISVGSRHHQHPEPISSPTKSRNYRSPTSIFSLETKKTSRVGMWRKSWAFASRQALQVDSPLQLSNCELINKLISSLEDRSLVASLQGQGSGHISGHLHFHFHLYAICTLTFFPFIPPLVYFHFQIWPAALSQVETFAATSFLSLCKTLSEALW